jgi:hypothetical protein
VLNTSSEDQGYAGFAMLKFYRRQQSKVRWVFLLLLFLPATAKASERDYQDAWCGEHGGQTEVVLADQTRVDCVTATHAVEFDFGKKWAESLGPALYYSIQTGKRAGIVLILNKPGDRKYLVRLKNIIQSLNLKIDVWEM